MAFDASLIPLPVLFLAPDVEEYARRRGFYGRFSDVAGTDPGTTWDDTVAQLDALLADPVVRAERIARAADLSASVHTYRDGENTARVYRAILNGAQLHSRVPEHRKSTA